MQRLPIRACRRAGGGRLLVSAPAAVPRRSLAAGSARRRVDSRDTRAALDTLNVQRMARERYDYDRRRLVFLVAGAVAGGIATVLTALKLKAALEANATKLDSGATGAPLSPRKVIVHDAAGREMVPTGDSTVPSFPRTLRVPDAGDAPETEYTLVGLGVRTVSFLSIRVYVVGYYVATADIAALQSRLVHRANPIATTLVPGEKEELRAALVDPAQSADLWNGLLQDGVPLRSAFRIVPVRDTDFPHLRDGLVRAIQAKAAPILKEEAAAGPDFGESVRQFRHIFSRGKAPKHKELLLVRGAGGRLSVLYDDGRPAGRQLLGSVDDERLSRALWMNYLGGAKVASEPARKSIADGVIEFVERPIGTVAAQVV